MAKIKKYIISIDAGGSSVRALLFDFQGKVVGREQTQTEVISTEAGAVEHDPEELWQQLKKVTDLNVQRNQLIDEIDEKIVDMINRAISGENLDNGKDIQRKHKTY